MPNEDPFRLRELGDDLDVRPNLSAAQVRRRGQARRTRRNVAAGLAVAAVVVAGGVTAVQLGANNRTPDWATTPTPAPTAQPSVDVTPSNGPNEGPSVPDRPISWDNVPAPEDMPDVGDSWDVGSEYEGWGQGTLTPCQGDVLPADVVLIRELVDANGWTFVAATMDFGSTDEASAATETIGSWYVSCGERLGDEYGAISMWQEPGEIPVSDELSDAGDVVALAGMTVALVEEGNDEGLITNGIVAQVDDRVTWVISDGLGMDQNCGLMEDESGGQCHAFAIANDVGLRLAE